MLGTTPHMMSTSTTPQLACSPQDSQAFLMSVPPHQNSASLFTAAEFEQSTTSQSHSLNHHSQGVKSDPQQIRHASSKFDVQQIPGCQMRGDFGLLPDWTTSPPFSCTSGFLPNFGSSSIEKRFSLDDDYDDDKTPMNSYKAGGILEHFQPSNASSCRDSGTESIDACDSADDCTAISTSFSVSRGQSSQSQNSTDNVKILHFFATDKSKSSFLPSRRAASRFVSEESMKNYPETGAIGNEEIQSDGESTLSESSLSPAEDDSQRITPELVVAAIDKKIKEQKQLLKNKKKKKSHWQRVVTKDDVAGDDEDSDNDSSSVSTTQTHTQCSDSVRKPENLPSFEIRDEDKNLVPIVEVEESSTDEEFGDGGRIPLIRSTSLKTGKTPPGTPRTKKIVRFADAMGLDLESVRTIADDVPYVPPVAAFKGLALEDDDIKWIYGQRSSTSSTSSGNGSGLHALSQSLISTSVHLSPTNSKPALRMLFCQPISDPGPFMERIRNFKVCLENCIVTGPNGPTDMFDLTCVIRVANLDFKKEVTLRYTSNEWLTWTNVAASYVPHSCDGFSDKFTCMFHIAVNSNGHQSMMPGQRLLFAVKYLVNGKDEFWDNNMGLNYALIYQRS